MRHTIFTTLLIGCLLYGRSSDIDAQQLSLSVSDTTICQGSEVQLTANYGNANNLKWEYIDDSTEDFQTFSTELQRSNSFQMNQATCFRLSSTNGSTTTYSNIECVGVLSPYTPNWMYRGEKMTSEQELNFCHQINNFGFNFEASGSFKKYFRSFWLIDGKQVAEVDTFIIDNQLESCQISHLVTSDVCKTDTFIFNLNVIQPPKLTINADKSGTICLGDTIIIDAETEEGAKLVWLAEKVYEGLFEEIYFEEEAESTTESAYIIPDEHTTHIPYSMEYKLGAYAYIPVETINSSSLCVTHKDIHLSVEEPTKLLPEQDTIYLCESSQQKSVNIKQMVETDNFNHFSEYKTVRWYEDGVLSSSDYDYDLPKEIGSHKVTVEIDGTACPSVKKDYTIIRDKMPSISISPIKNHLCEGDSIELKAIIEGGNTFEWQSVNASGQKKETLSNTQHNIIVSPKVSSYYKFISKNGACDASSEIININVRPSLEVDVQTNLEGKDITICHGELSSFDADVRIHKGMASSYSWKANGSNLSSAASFSNSLDHSIQYELTVSNGECPAYHDTFRVTLLETPEVSVEDVTICEGSTATLIAKHSPELHSQWFDEDGSLLSEGSLLSVSPTDNSEYYVEVSREYGNTTCTTRERAYVTIASTPTITNHAKINGTTYHLTAEGGTGLLTFNYDDVETESNVITVEPHALYTITVKDEIGCSSSYILETEDYELNIPEYFVANRENWMIEHIDKFSNATVDIYDRTGKLLVHSIDFIEGWDGKYMGKDMPTTDYWYVVNLPSIDRQRTGHFTLLREK